LTAADQGKWPGDSWAPRFSHYLREGEEECTCPTLWWCTLPGTEDIWDEARWTWRHKSDC